MAKPSVWAAAMSAGHFSIASYVDAVSGVDVCGADGVVWLACPFHDDGARSLRVDVPSERYRCLCCGLAGRGVAALHALRTGVSKAEAQAHLDRVLAAQPDGGLPIDG